MTETCRKAVTSLRECARRNIQQARTYREEGRLRIAGYHWLVALSCRADANALASTARPAMQITFANGSRMQALTNNPQATARPRKSF